MKRAIWLSYDLGVMGDYEGIYSWLENHGAKECGSSVAFLQEYEFKDDLLECLKADIKEAVTLGKRSRIYVVFPDEDGGKPRGRYLFGKRKVPPWTGFGDIPEEEFDSD